jgi:RNA-directed DNA polymerase
VIAELNPVLRGWGQYFRSGNAAGHVHRAVDGYVVRRLKSLRIKRAGRNLKAGQAQRWDREYYEQLGLYRLRGTIRYPAQASWQQESRVMLRADRPLVSRVREIRMHGLEGGVGSWIYSI